jgi:hypothetical protein
MIYPLLLFFLSCQNNGSKSGTKSGFWSVSQMETGQEEFNSSRLTYSSRDKINGIDLEWIQTEDKLYCYLQVHAHPIQHPRITLIIDDRIEAFDALCHRGGHRLLLPEEASQKIMVALRAHQSLALKVDGYESMIDPTSFEQSLQKMQKPLFFHKLFSL